MSGLKNLMVDFILSTRKKTYLVKKSKIKKIIKDFPDYHSFSFGRKNKNTTFYVIKKSKASGIFSILIYVLNHLILSEKINAVPVVDMENFASIYNEDKVIKNTKNSWLYYFDQVSKYKLKDIYRSQKVIFTSDKRFLNESISYKENTKKLKYVFKKYIKIDKKLKNIANNFIKKNFFKKKVLAIHWRGSDMKVSPNHPFPPTKKQILNLADKLIKKKKFNKIFVITEEKKYLKILKDKYGSMICCLNSFRLNNRNEFYNSTRQNHRYRLGRDSIIEAIILSKLSTLICSRSGISEAAVFMSDNKKYKLYEIDNGLNSASIIHSLYLWRIKNILPKFLGGF